MQLFTVRSLTYIPVTDILSHTRNGKGFRAMDRVIAFLQSGTGRITRIVFGIVLIVVGFLMQGVAGFIIGLVGAIPLIAGIAGVCLFAPLFGYTLHGHRRLQQTGPLY